MHLLGKWNIRRAVKDKALRRKLTPNYRAGCKRILNSDTYYRGIANPKTQVITERIARLTPRTASSPPTASSMPVDVVVFATGFHVTDSYSYVDIKGPGGEDLVDRWTREGVEAHRGVTVADMPNLFFLLGPNTGAGPQLGGVHDRVPDPLRRQGHRRGRTGRGPRPLAPTQGGAGRVQRRLQGELARHGVEHRRLPELVHGRARRESDAVERHDLAVLAGDPPSSSLGVRRSSALSVCETATRQHKLLCCGASSYPSCSVEAVTRHVSNWGSRCLME